MSDEDRANNLDVPFRCSKIKFCPGDRLVLYVSRSASVNSVKLLLKAAQKWAGPEVEVIAIPQGHVQMEVNKEEVLNRDN